MHVCFVVTRTHSYLSLYCFSCSLFFVPFCLFLFFFSFSFRFPLFFDSLSFFLLFFFYPIVNILHLDFDANTGPPMTGGCSSSSSFSIPLADFFSSRFHD